MKTQADEVASEDDLMMRLVNQSVNRIWSDYDTSKDGYLTLEESRQFILDSFGKTSPNKFTE